MPSSRITRTWARVSVRHHALSRRQFFVSSFTLCRQFFVSSFTFCRQFFVSCSSAGRQLAVSDSFLIRFRTVSASPSGCLPVVRPSPSGLQGVKEQTEKRRARYGSGNSQGHFSSKEERTERSKTDANWSHLAPSGTGISQGP